MVSTTSRFLSSLHQLPLINIAYWLLLSLPIGILIGRSAMDISFTFMGLAFLAHCIKHKDWQLFTPTWVKLGLVIWAYLFIRSIFALDVANNIDRGLFFGRFIIGALAIEWVMMHRQNASRRLFQLLTPVMLFIMFDVYYQYFVGSDLLGHEILGNRLTGPFKSPMVGNVLLLFSFPLLCWCLANYVMKPNSLRQLMSGLLLSLLFIGAIFVTGERMVFILCLFGIFVASLLMPSLRKVSVALIGVLAILITLIGLINPKIIDRQLHSSQTVIKHFRDTQYGQIWRNGIKVGLQKPLIGVGPRNFREICPSLPLLEVNNYPIREQCNLHTHNIYLEWFSETGLIGLGLFVALVGLLLQTLLNAVWRDRNDAVIVGFCVFAIAYLWPLRTSSSFFTNSFAVPFWFMLGWGLALSKQRLVKPIHAD